MTRIMPVRIVLRGVVAIAATVALAVAPAAGAAANVPPPPSPQGATSVQGGSSTLVTLVTGDRVRVVTAPDGTRSASLLAEPTDSESGGIVTRHGEDIVVVPLEALPYLRSGALDPALFNVTQLIADGMADGVADGIRLLVTSPASPLAPGAVPSSARTGVMTAPEPPAESTETARAASLGLTGVSVEKSQAREFWAGLVGNAATSDESARTATTVGGQLGQGVGRLWLDRKVRASLDRSVPQIGAPAAYAAGLDGTGVTIAVLDTGIDDQNPDVAPKVVAEQDFTEEGTTDDLFGHGTHVASIAAGSGAASGGKYHGVAPGASLIDARGLDRDGYGYDSWIIAAMEWSAQQGADVINMSLGGYPTDGTDPLAQAVNAVTDQYGTLFVVAAGNSGPGASIDSPGSADAALTVGSVDRADVVSWFSSQGPRLGDGALKPEISAPGEDIVAAQADGTQLGPVGPAGYVALSGTSMATPHVAGAAALLLEADPSLTPGALKTRLVTSAAPQPDTSVYAGGVGRVDVAAAIAPSDLSVDAATVNLGFYPWPHGAEVPVTQTLTYTNTSGTASTVNIIADLGDTDGAPLDPAALTVSPTTLSLPAGASGAVDITVDPATAAPGDWSGRITATSSAGATVRTGVGFVSETEKYNLSVKVLDRNGRPAEFADAFLFNLDTGEALSSWDLADPSDLTFRASPGTWSVSANSFVDAGGTTDSFLAIEPEVSVTGDTTLTLDLRKARRVSLTVADATVRTEIQTIGFSRESENGGIGFGASSGEGNTYVTPTSRVTIGSLTFGAFNSLRVPALTADIVSGKHVRLHPYLAWGGTQLDGERTVRVRPTPKPGEFGLLAVDTEGPIDEQVAALAAAGAAGVIAYATSPEVYWWVDAEPAIPVIYVSPDEGALLADRAAGAQVRVKLVGQYVTPRAYDIGKEWTGAIPRTVTKRFAVSDLARINEEYRTMNGPGEAWQVQLPLSSTGGFFASIPVPVGGTRSTYVSPEFDWFTILDYGSSVIPELGFALPSVSWDDPVTSYSKGQTTSREWLRQVARPAVPPGEDYLVAVRSGDQLFAYVPLWTDGQGRISSSWGFDDVDWTLTSGGKQLAAGSDPFIGAELPAARKTYTLDVRAALAADPTWRLSTATQTRWTFRSAHTDPETYPPLPLISVDAAIPLDADNTAPVGQSMTFEVSGRMPAGVPATRVTSMKVETSANGGGTWTSGTLKRVDDDTFQVTVKNPPTAGDVALRITAKAGDGVSINQEVMAAYAVR